MLLPLHGTTQHLEEQQPTYYRLNRLIFAEPIDVLQNQKDKTIEDQSPERRRDSDAEERIDCDNLQASTIVVSVKRDNEQVDDARSSVCPAKSGVPIGADSEHARSALGADGERERYRCEACAKPFALRYLLERHLAVHRGTKQACPVCHKLLSVRTSLAVHLRSHSRARPFACSLCGRAFGRRSVLASHARFRHPGADGLACNKCAERFNRRIDLERHKRGCRRRDNTPSAEMT